MNVYKFMVGANKTAYVLVVEAASTQAAKKLAQDYAGRGHPVLYMKTPGTLEEYLGSESRERFNRNWRVRFSEKLARVEHNRTITGGY